MILLAMPKRSKNPRYRGTRVRKPILINPTSLDNRTQIHAYNNHDLTLLFDMTHDALRKAISRGQVDPSSLSSICEYYIYRGEKITKTDR